MTAKKGDGFSTRRPVATHLLMVALSVVALAATNLITEKPLQIVEAALLIGAAQFVLVKALK